MIPMMLEAALRSLLLALAVAAGLRLLGVRNVPAQKAAWSLVLAAALAMPLLLPLAGRVQILPSAATITLPAHLLNRIASFLPRPARHPEALPVVVNQTVNHTAPLSETLPVQSFTFPAITSAAARPTSSSEYTVSKIYEGTQSLPQPGRETNHGPTLAELASLAYFAVAVTLLFRLFVGLASALLIWMEAVPMASGDAPGLVEGLSLRASRAVSSPVTIGSAVVLPVDFPDWDAGKLRVVLAHERSHIRQGDFYLQLLAGLYAAIFWLSPLGWWLKSRLSDLAETISDRAGLEQASDCSSYAQILLEFAAAPRTTLTGVAMAHPGRLSRRIERLLNQPSFSQAFAGSRARIFAVVLLVPMALFAATSLIHVKAATQDAPPAAARTDCARSPAGEPSPAPQAEAPITGQAAPEAGCGQHAPPAPDLVSAADSGPRLQLRMLAPVPPDGAPASRRSYPLLSLLAAPSDRVIVVPRTPRRVIVMPNLPRTIVVPEIPAMTIHVPDTVRMMASAKAYSYGESYSYSMNDGESYGIVRGNGEHVQFSGDLHTADIDKIRKQAHGDFLWFKRDGKYYFVDDPATLARIEALYKPMEELGKQQEALGRQQEALGRQQESLADKQEQATIPAPDISKEMASVTEAMQTLQSKMGKAITRQELADVQGKLGDLQGRLGELQGDMGARQGQFGAQQGKLGEEMGRLGAMQGRLGAEQGRLGREADRTVRSIIDQSVKDGKAHPVQ